MARTPDIRVRLTPEGVNQVIDALRKVNSEADKSSKRAGRGVGVLNEALGELKGLLPAIGFAAAVTGMVSMARTALNTADQFGKVAQQVGTTSENFSVLAFSAATADVSNEELGKSLGTLARRIGDLRRGTQEQVEAFAELGLSARSFDGLDSAQSFDLVASRISALDDPLKKTQVAIEVFGRAGAKLIPLLNDVGTRGFDAVRKDAEKLGLIISTDLAKAAEAANDSLTLVGLQARGLALQFITGLAPAITDAMTQFREDTTGNGVESMREFGEVTGRVLRVVIDGFRLFSNLIGNTLSSMGDGIGATAAAIAEAARGNFGTAFDIIRERFTKVRSDVGTILSDIDKDWDRLVTNASKDPQKIELPIKVKQPGAGEIQESRRTVDQIMGGLTKQLGEAELKNLENLSKQRRALVEGDVEVERKLLEARLANSRNQIDIQKRLLEQETAGFETKLRALQESAAAELDIERAKAEAVQRRIRQTASDEKQLRQLSDIAARQSADRQITIAQNYYTELQKLQVAAAERYKQATKAIQDIDNESRRNRLEGERLFGELRLGLFTKEQQFGLRRRQADEKIAELQKAATGGDIARARELRAEVIELASTLARAEDVQGVSRAQAIRIGENLFEEANTVFERALLAQRNVEQAAANSAAKQAENIAKQLETMRAQLDQLKNHRAEISLAIPDNELRAVAQQIQDFLTRTPFQIAVAANVSGGSTLPTLASGGGVPGHSPHSRADNVVIRATAGEFMQPVRAVRYYGSDFMEDIRNLRLPRFADGGMIGGDGGSSAVPEQAVNLSFNGRPIGRMRGSRETVRAFTDMMRQVSKGVNE